MSLVRRRLRIINIISRSDILFFNLQRNYYGIQTDSSKQPTASISYIEPDDVAKPLANVAKPLANVAKPLADVAKPLDITCSEREM
jgi:hypothetical protein